MKKPIDKAVEEMLIVFGDHVGTVDRIQALVGDLYSRVRSDRGAKVLIRKMMKAVGLPVPKKKKGKK